MLRGIIRGHIVSTRKHDRLVGSKFMEVQIMKNGELTDEYVIAVDCGVGAGIGETVLVATGSAARIGCGMEDTPVDAAIVGIIDEGQDWSK